MLHEQDAAWVSSLPSTSRPPWTCPTLLFLDMLTTQLYALGGWNSAWAILTSVEVLDLSEATPTWRAGPALPVPRWEHARGS